MSYMLEKLHLEDLDNIIADVADVRDRQRDLVYARDHYDVFPKTWVIDRERNCYMVKLPSLVREPWVGVYLLFFAGRSYLAFSDDLFGRRMYFDNVHKPSSSLMEEVTQEFIAALKAHGMFGSGPWIRMASPSQEPLRPAS